MQYIFRERQDLASLREGAVIEAESLAEAKAQAEAAWAFQGTVVSLETPDGRLVSWCRDGESWHDEEEI